MNINSISIIFGGIFLLICSLYDIRYKQIPIKWIRIGGIFSFLWIALTIFTGQWGYLCGSFLGILLLLLGKITGEKIGYGDGFVIIIVGVLDTFYVSFFTFIMALLFVSAYGVVLVCIKKVSRTFTIPFIPFYFVAYVLWYVVNF